jgi:hypothetical protein
MTQKKYKKPSDYPQFAFRLTQVEKDALIANIDYLHKVANKDKKKDEFKYNKNALTLDAINIGLGELARTNKWGKLPNRKHYRKPSN